MARKPAANNNSPAVPKRAFHLEFLNAAQKMAWAAFERDEVLFLLGPAGSGKSHLATAFAISELLAKKKRRIILTRPIVESGESLGFLPGTFDEKVNPYMLPLYDCIGKLVGWEGPEREKVDRALEVAPLAYMRGRSQPLDAKVLTPNGFSNMGDLQIGNKVTGLDGQPIEIVGVYPQGQLDVYKVYFSDGTSVECSDDHLWHTMTLNEKRHNKGYSVKTTKQIRETLKNRHGQKIHRIPIAQPVYFHNDKILRVDPYVLGVILGDGNTHKKTSITITNVAQDVVLKVSELLQPHGLRLVMAKSEGKSPQYRVVGKKERRNPVRSYLSEQGLLGLKSYEKYVPSEYLYAPIMFRLEVLRGLMDTDGSVFEHRSGNSRVQYYSTSLQLAKDVRFLVHSLGGTASLRKREYAEDAGHGYQGKTIRHCRPLYVVDIVIAKNPFSMKAKSERFKSMNPQRIISKVEYVGRKECQCIQVAAKDHLYLTDHCIVTHNTFDDAVCIFDEAQNASFMQLKLFLTRFGENSKIIVTGDPTQSDLRGEVALSGVVEKLKEEPGIGVVEFTNANIVRHPLVGRILERLG